MTTFAFETDDLDPGLLERYWLRETSPEEAAEVESWLSAHPRHRAWYEQMRAGLASGSRTAEVPVQASAMTEAVLKAIRQPLGARPALRPRSHRWIGITAGVAVTVLVGVAGWITARTSFSDVATPAGRIYTTALGQRAELRMADGTVISLGPSSRLDVSSTAGGRVRDVALDGEAHFTVSANSNAPFRVRTGAIVTRVLGTRFVVAHDSEREDVRVLVESGKVAVEAPNIRPAVLDAGALALATDSSVTVHAATKLPVSVEWHTGKLVFDRAALPDVLSALHRWYGVDFHLADSALATYRVSGDMPYGSMVDMLTTLRNLLNVSLAIDSSHTTPLVTLKSRSNSAPRLWQPSQSTSSPRVGK